MPPSLAILSPSLQPLLYFRAQPPLGWRMNFLPPRVAEKFMCVRAPTANKWWLIARGRAYTASAFLVRLRVYIYGGSWQMFWSNIQNGARREFRVWEGGNACVVCTRVSMRCSERALIISGARGCCESAVLKVAFQRFVMASMVTVLYVFSFTRKWYD